MHPYRTHTCAQLSSAQVGQTVRLSGWVHRKRDFGGLLFVDLRDHYGITQIVADADSPALVVLDRLRVESVITIEGEVKARSAYAKLLTIAKGELAAEALYYDAYFKNKDGKYEESNKTVQKLAKDYSGYKYFGAKGLIVMSKNYYQMKDNFSATSILDSVIKNFASFEDVVAEAQTELDMIKGEAAKTNSSITE